jgi:hypothetical protein
MEVVLMTTKARRSQNFKRASIAAAQLTPSQRGMFVVLTTLQPLGLCGFVAKVRQFLGI